MRKFDVKEHKITDDARLEIVTWEGGQVDYTVSIADRPTGHVHTVSFDQRVADEVAKLLASPKDVGEPHYDDKEPSHHRVDRGGAWLFGAGYCRSAARAGFVPGYRDFYLGFRLAKEFKMKQTKYIDMALRGGSWCSDTRYCRSAFRDWSDPGRRLNNGGFRLAKEIKNEAD